MYANMLLKFKKGCKQIAENCRGGLPSAPVHPPSWGAEHAPDIYILIHIQSADRTVSSFVDSSAQHRGNEAEPDSNGNKNFQSGPNVPCQSAQTDKSVSSA